MDILTSAERFREHYLLKHSGRRLTWRTDLGNADIRSFIGEQKHEMIVSTCQMCILLLYNTQDQIQFQNMVYMLNTSDEELVRHLMGLIKAGILLKSEDDLGVSIISLN